MKGMSTLTRISERIESLSWMSGRPWVFHVTEMRKVNREEISRMQKLSITAHNDEIDSPDRGRRDTLLLHQSAGD